MEVVKVISDMTGVSIQPPYLAVIASSQHTEDTLRAIQWLIDETERLYIREFVKEDAENIPEEEYGKEEEIFPDTGAGSVLKVLL